MKYGIKFNINDSNQILNIIFKGFDFDTFKLINYSSEIYIENNQNSYEIFGDNEIYEIAHNQIKHTIVDLNIKLSKLKHCVSFYCYDGIGILLFENEKELVTVRVNI